MADGDKDADGAQRTSSLSSIADSQSYRTLVRERSRLSWSLTAIILVVYFGYILLIAFEREVLARPIGDSTVTVGIPMGIGVILIGIGLTAVYVYRANRRFDALLRTIRDEAGQ